MRWIVVLLYGALITCVIADQSSAETVWDANEREAKEIETTRQARACCSSASGHGRASRNGRGRRSLCLQGEGGMEWP